MRPCCGLLLGWLIVLAGGRASADVVTDWNATIREVLRSEGSHPENRANPGWSTRSIAMMNGAIYDVFQSFDRTHTPFLADFVAQDGTSRDAAVHQAAFDVLRHCYPREATWLESHYQSQMAPIPEGFAKDEGMSLGRRIALMYMQQRASDGADQMVPYTPGDQPGQWRPDPWHPDQTAWGPGWGQVTPFAIPDTGAFIDALPPIPALDSQAYTEAFEQVKQYGAKDSTARTAEQTEIGLFWAYDRAEMGAPPVMFVSNLEEIAHQAGNTPEENARMFAMASVGMADAAIAAWDAKFEHNFWRPATAIHEAGTGGPDDADGNPHTVADPEWKPLGAPGPDPDSDADDFTPPFPAWTSGHATMGGALFKSLELFYGTNSFEAIDGIMGNDPLYELTSQELGVTDARQYATFTQTGLTDVGLENSPEGEVAMSRIYLGVHWIFDERDGVRLGNDIAQWVAANRFQPVPEPASLWAWLFAISWLLSRSRRDAN